MGASLLALAKSIITLVIDLIGQLRRDVFGRQSVKPWCYWLWRLVISSWCVSIRLLSQLNSRQQIWLDTDFQGIRQTTSQLEN